MGGFEAHVLGHEILPFHIDVEAFPGCKKMNMTSTIEEIHGKLL
jgi:hypothetical protein